MAPNRASRKIVTIIKQIENQPHPLTHFYLIGNKDLTTCIVCGVTLVRHIFTECRYFVKSTQTYMNPWDRTY